MKLTIRLVMAIGAAMLLVVAFNAWLRLQREDELFRSDMERDARVVARELALAAREVWGDEGEAGVRRLLEEANTSTEGLSVALRFTSEGALPGGVVHGPDAVRCYASVRVQDPRGPTIEVSEPLEPAARYRRTTIWNALRSAASLLAASILTAALVGGRLVARPIAALIDVARRVGRGELGAEVAVLPSDELGALGREINAMSRHLARLQRALEAEHRERLDVLDALRHADRLATAGQLAAMVAHELGTPLNVVAGRAKLIGRAEATPAVHENAAIIAEQVTRMSATIRQLLDFTRRDGGARTTQDVRAIAQRTVDLLGRVAERAGVRLRLEAGGLPLRAHVAALQLEQVLANLIMNAVQATPGGGTTTVKLGAERRAPPSGGEPRDVVTLAVTDTGAGIPPEHRSRLFQPFFTTKPRGTGTGLGLAVVYGIVSAHEGWVEVESELGRGSCFTVALPAALDADPSGGLIP